MKLRILEKFNTLTFDKKSGKWIRKSERESGAPEAEAQFRDQLEGEGIDNDTIEKILAEYNETGNSETYDRINEEGSAVDKDAFGPEGTDAFRETDLISKDNAVDEDFSIEELRALKTAMEEDTKAYSERYPNANAIHNLITKRIAILEADIAEVDAEQNKISEESKRLNDENPGLLEKLSRSLKDQFDIDATPESFNLVEPTSELEKAAVRVGSVFGQKVVFVDVLTSDVDVFNGDTTGGTIVLNRNSSNPHVAVAGHEITHRLRQEFPKLYDSLASVINEDAKAFRKFRADRQETFPLTPYETPEDIDMIMEEFIGDTVGERISDPEFWQKMNAKSPSLVQKVKELLNTILRNLSVSKDFTTSEFFKDIQKVRDVVDSTLTEFAAKKAPPGEKVAPDKAESKKPVAPAPETKKTTGISEKQHSKISKLLRRSDMKSGVIWLFILLLVSGYIYYGRRGASQRKRQQEELCELQKAEVAEFASRYNANLNWKSGLENKDTIFTLDVERRWIGSRPILFGCYFDDVISGLDGKCSIVLKEDFMSISMSVFAEFKLHLICPYDKIKPLMLDSKITYSELAVIANITNVRRETDSDGYLCFIGIGECLDILVLDP